MGGKAAISSRWIHLPLFGPTFQPCAFSSAVIRVSQSLGHLRTIRWVLLRRPVIERFSLLGPENPAHLYYRGRWAS